MPKSVEDLLEVNEDMVEVFLVLEIFLTEASEVEILLCGAPAALKPLSIHFDLCVDATGVVCHQPGLLGTDLHAVCCGGLVETLN